MSIQAFVFDCGGVLLRNGDLSAYTQWEERLGLERGELARRLWMGELWTLAERGQVSDAEFWRRAGHSLGLTDSEQIAALREDLWQTWIVDDKVLALIDRLRAKHRVAMLSNMTDALEEILATRYGVADRFEMIFNSARMGMAKPESQIYEAMMQRLGLTAQEIVLIDDRAENITVAATMGMHVVWYVHADELERQLLVYLNNPNGNGKREAVSTTKAVE